MVIEWIYIAVIAGSIATSGYETKEACLGHKAIREEAKEYGECIKTPGTLTSSGTALLNNFQTFCQTPAGLLVDCPRSAPAQ